MESPLRLIRRELNLTQNELAEKMGIGKSAVSMIETGKSNLTSQHRIVLVQLFNVNSEWLESGQGKMFISKPEFDSGSRCMELPSAGIPLYRVTGRSTISALIKDSSGIDPVSHIYIPDMPKCDGAVYLEGVGDGMYPLLSNGDIVLYKKMSPDYIFWGEIYLISIRMGIEEFSTVRYVMKSDNPRCVRLSGENPRHSSQEVDIGDILALASVTTVIRMSYIK